MLVRNTLKKMFVILTLVPILGVAQSRDSGGGNSTNGRLIEMTHLEPQNLPEYNKYMKLAIDRMNRTVPEFAHKFEERLHYISFFVVPHHLMKLPSKETGIPVPSDQIARQKNGEVWIDEELYNGTNKQKGLDNKSKNALLIHETLLSLIKRKTYELNLDRDSESVHAAVRKMTQLFMQGYEFEPKVYTQSLYTLGFGSFLTNSGLAQVNERTKEILVKFKNTCSKSGEDLQSNFGELTKFYFRHTPDFYLKAEVAGEGYPRNLYSTVEMYQSYVTGRALIAVFGGENILTMNYWAIDEAIPVKEIEEGCKKLNEFWKKQGV